MICVRILCMLVAMSTPAYAGRRYVGTTTSGAATARTTVAKVKWTVAGVDASAFLTAKYRCRGAAGSCPSKRKGALRGEMVYRGADFGGTVTFRGLDGGCTISGTLLSRDNVLWEQGQPLEDAPVLMLVITCGGDSFSFLGEVP